MPKKKKRKSKIQKRLERGSSINSAIKNDFHEFVKEYVDHMGLDFDGSTETEIEEEFKNLYRICTLAWDLSEQKGTYEKSMEELGSVQMTNADPSKRMTTKYMIVCALRVLYSLSADKESVDQTTKEILNPEELKSFNENIV